MKLSRPGGAAAHGGKTFLYERQAEDRNFSQPAQTESGGRSSELYQMSQRHLRGGRPLQALEAIQNASLTCKSSARPCRRWAPVCGRRRCAHKRQRTVCLAKSQARCAWGSQAYCSYTSHTYCAALLNQEADILRALQRNGDAIKVYKLSLALKPHQWKVECNLGALYHVAGDFGTAWHHYAVSISLNPGNTILRSNMQKLIRASRTGA